MKKPSAALLAKWEQKLKDSGFVDIESKYGNDWHLKRYESNYFVQASHGWRGPDVHQAHVKYFEDARARMHTYNFNNKYDKTIWWLHANGLYIREIAKLVKCSKSKVGLDLQRLKREVLCLN